MAGLGLILALLDSFSISFLNRSVGKIAGYMDTVQVYRIHMIKLKVDI